MNAKEAMSSESDIRKKAKELDRLLTDCINVDTMHNKQFQSRCDVISHIESALREERDRAICDCHNWASAKELHDYCMSLEKKLIEEREKAIREAVNIALAWGDEGVANDIILTLLPPKEGV